MKIWVRCMFAIVILALSHSAFTFANFTSSTWGIAQNEDLLLSIRCFGYKSSDMPYVGINSTLLSVSNSTPPWSGNNGNCRIEEIDGRLFFVSGSNQASAVRLAYSDDKGASWTVATITGSPSILRGKISKMSSGKLIIEGVNGILTSINNGANWTFISNTSINGCGIVKMKHLNRLVCSRGTQLKYSDDEGATWINTLALNSTTQKSGTIFIGNRIITLPYNSGQAVHYSDDGVNWFSLGNTSLQNSGGIYVSKSISGVTYLIRGSGLFKSIDGTNWTTILPAVGSISSSAFCGDYYYEYKSSTMYVRYITTGVLITSFPYEVGAQGVASCIDQTMTTYQ